jgi:hypothetical protein
METSMTALVNSADWQGSAFSEGEINLNSPNLGNIDLGNMENIISSAYCKADSGKDLHLTWFSNHDAHGHVSMKGVNSNNIGSLVADIKNFVPAEQIGFYKDDNTIKMADSPDIITLSENCESITIPTGTVVTFGYLDGPKTNIANDSSRNVTRTKECGANYSGNSVQFLNNVQVMPDGKLMIGSKTFANEALLKADDSLPWNNLQNCVEKQIALSLEKKDGTTNLLKDIHTLGNSNDVEKLLVANLGAVDCRKTYKIEGDKQNKTLYADTCESGEGLKDIEAPIVRHDEIFEITKLSCPVRKDKVKGKQVTYNPSTYKIGSFFNGSKALLNRNDFGASGYVELKKTTYTRTQENLQLGGEPLKHHRFETVGQNVSCTARDQLIFSCKEIYSDWLNSSANKNRKIQVTGPGPIYNAYYKISGWENPETLKLKDGEYSTDWFRTNVMQCKFVESKETSKSCPPGYTGSKVTHEERTATLKTPRSVNSSDWSDWNKTDLDINCKKKPKRGAGGGGGDGESGSGVDVDGDGDADLSRSQANAKGITGPTVAGDPDGHYDESQTNPKGGGGGGGSGGGGGGGFGGGGFGGIVERAVETVKSWF